MKKLILILFMTASTLFVGCELFKTKSLKKDEPAPYDGVLIGKKLKAEPEEVQEEQPAKEEADQFEPRTDEAEEWTLPKEKSSKPGSTL